MNQTKNHYASISGFYNITRVLYPDSAKRWVFTLGGDSLLNPYTIPLIDTQRGTYFRSFYVGLGMPVPYLKRTVTGYSNTFFHNIVESYIAMLIIDGKTEEEAKTKASQLIQKELL